MTESQTAYTTKEISDLLGIGTSTLRKWCLALEKNEPLFLRTEGNKRLFTDHDIIILKHFKQLVQTGNMPLENASNVVTSRFKKEAFSSGTPAVLEEKEEYSRSSKRSDEVFDTLIEHINHQQEYIERQEQFNKNLLERLDKQQRYIEERLNERDQRLIEQLHHSLEERRQLQAATEDANNKGGFFKRLFGQK